MAETITLKLTVPRIPLLSNEGSRTVLYREAGAAVQTIVETIATEVRGRTPVATGLLRASISTNVQLGSSLTEAIRGTVFSGSQAPYAVFVEEGTRPHWPPIGPLLLWARRVLGDERAAWAIQRAIARRGTRGRHMFRDGMQAAAPRLDSIFQAAMQRAATRLQGEG